METIVKIQDAAANALIDTYLAWAKMQPWYGVNIDYTYKKFGEKHATGYSIKHTIVDTILLPEQSNHCCYCMRRITNHADDASIEHIVPKSTTTYAGLTHYFSARSGNLNAANVCLTSDFIRNGSVAPPYPHHVAYRNFAVACRGCNSRRGHEAIEPLFLFAGIHREVNYNEYSGEVDWPLDPAYANPIPVLPTLETVGINRPLLKAIRVVWFYAKRNGLDPNSVSRDDLIYGALGDCLSMYPGMSDDEFNAYLSLCTEGMWNILLKYDYFGR